MNGSSSKKIVNAFKYQGLIYSGEICHGVPHGKGKSFCTRTKNIYNGSWKNGVYNGTGTLTFRDPNSNKIYEFIGNFKKGKRKGKGKMILKMADIPIRDEKIKEFLKKIYEGKIDFTINDKIPFDFNNSHLPFSYDSNYEVILIEGIWIDNSNCKQCFAKYSNGIYYYGNISENMPNGIGVAIMNGNQKLYVGKWMNGKFHETGKLFEIGKSIYEGNFLNGKKHGNGTIIHIKNKASYSGIWEDDELSGYCCVVYDDNSMYLGIINNYKRTGFGSYHYPNGLVYHGEWLNDKRYGKGRVTLLNGDIIECSWDDNKMLLPITIIYQNGNRYDGICDNNLDPSEVGKMIYSDGTIYEGEWLNGKRHGKGNFITKEKTMISCFWYNDEPCYYQHITYPNGDIYFGNCSNMEPNGYGSMIYHNNTLYKGMWSNGKRNGKGSLYINGNMYHCIWNNDEPTNPFKISFSNGNKYHGECNIDLKPHGSGSMKYADGSIYIGSWVNGKRHGMAIYRMANSDYYSGMWENDLKNGIGIYYYFIGNFLIEYYWENDSKISCTLRWYYY